MDRGRERATSAFEDETVRALNINERRSLTAVFYSWEHVFHRLANTEISALQRPDQSQRLLLPSVHLLNYPLYKKLCKR